MSIELLDGVVRAQKGGQARAAASICSAHPAVLQAVMRRASRSGTSALVEATCNQVNQFGGYTGMTPEAFTDFARGLAERAGLPPDRLLLGGDHMGPLPWRDGPTERAMQRAGELVRLCVRAGFRKIHLDASMALGGDDPQRPLDLELIARRTAWLARAAEEACPQAPPGDRPRYVIGSEVPPPGGATSGAGVVCVTSAEAARRTWEVTRQAFEEEGLQAAWERVAALVVQPGVEFGDDFVHDYRPEAAADLARLAETVPLVYEAHSTDHQSREALRQLVRDHFAVLKVGPALTYAYRSAVFALAMMEGEMLPPSQRSHLIETLEEAMLRRPEHWRKHYRGAPEAQALARRFSLSDRIRYYWPDPSVQAALSMLLANLGRAALPLTLIEQFAPLQYERVRAGELAAAPEAIVRDRLDRVLMDYEYACEPGRAP